MKILSVFYMELKFFGGCHDEKITFYISSVIFDRYNDGAENCFNARLDQAGFHCY